MPVPAQPGACVRFRAALHSHVCAQSGGYCYPSAGRRRRASRTRLANRRGLGGPFEFPNRLVGGRSRVRGNMTDKSDHIVWAAEAVAVFQKHCRTGDEHVIADLICDLGHLAEDLGFDFLSEVRRGIGHWYAEQHLHDGEVLGPDAAVDIIIMPRSPARRQGPPETVCRARPAAPERMK